MTRYATEYGAFCIEQIPNQPQIAHCHSFHIKDSFRGRVLEACGWERKDEFNNSATGSTTILWGWNVQQIKEAA